MSEYGRDYMKFIYDSLQQSALLYGAIWSDRTTQPGGYLRSHALPTLAFP